jgi:hypothetical protein
MISSAAAVDRAIVIASLKRSIIFTALFTLLSIFLASINQLDWYIASLVLTACLIGYIAFIYSQFTYRLAKPRWGWQLIKYSTELFVFWGGLLISCWLFVTFIVYLRSLLICVDPASSCDVLPYVTGTVLSIAVGIFVFVLAWAIYAAKESYEEMLVEVNESINKSKDS